MEPRRKHDQDSLSIFGMLEKWILALKNFQVAMPKVDEVIDNHTIGFITFVLKNRFREDPKLITLNKIEGIVYQQKYTKP